jgi:hypothetical protein
VKREGHKYSRGILASLEILMGHLIKVPGVDVAELENDLAFYAKFSRAEGRVTESGPVEFLRERLREQRRYAIADAARGPETVN